ncbi:Hypothetical protein I596_3329 [Dokdonella koreensis DS-123]|uniref:Uncharacterized protein n=1 Tax=Dokdonella koreensis DS-123 TaxID=1300342 RepID=A0A160DX89_9GAMM|nr:Hypothetical protein I596_3329 [Dokdonella koreensis DS-123]
MERSAAARTRSRRWPGHAWRHLCRRALSCVGTALREARIRRQAGKTIASRRRRTAPATGAGIDPCPRTA